MLTAYSSLPMQGFKSTLLLLLLPLALAPGCSKQSPGAATKAAPAKHEHHAPHGGTIIVLGNELYHLELVREPVGGILQAYIFDGELEFFVRASTPSFEMTAVVDGQPQRLVFMPVPNAATGETTGDTALYMAQADWLKTVPAFNATLHSLTIRGHPFADVKFNFPQGNDAD